MYQQCRNKIVFGKSIQEHELKIIYFMISLKNITFYLDIQQLRAFNLINHLELYYSYQMKIIIVLGLIYALSVQQTVLISSSVSNTIVTAPSNYVTASEAYYTLNYPGRIGYGAEWIYKNGTGGWPVGDYAVFYTTFYADCQQQATLIIEADDTFTASLNGGSGFSGSGWGTIFKFSINNLVCGANSLSIRVTNTGKNTPGALIFAVIQDQSTCYDCSSQLSFFNRKTCKCQCVDRCSCSGRQRYYWFDYPVCGCKCIQVLACSDGKYFNGDTCTCECKPAACLPGYSQSSSSCQCSTR